MRSTLNKITNSMLTFISMFALLSCTAEDGSNAVVAADKGNDINNYKTVTIGKQTWMAENLNYAVAGSKCYNNKPDNCDKYGRLYDFPTAMALPNNCLPNDFEDENSNCYLSEEMRQGICPDGWHIPSAEDWTALMNYVGKKNAGIKLRTGDWELLSKGMQGKDKHGFSALPGGYYNGKFEGRGALGQWWSSSYNNARPFVKSTSSWDYKMLKVESFTTNLNSIRCVKD